MKKTTVLLTAALLALTAILGCAASTPAPAPAVTEPAEQAAEAPAAVITISTKPKTVTTEMAQLMLLIRNDSGKTYSTDYVQKLEVLTDGVWQEVPLTTEAVSLALVAVPSGELTEYEFDFENHYAPLTAGRYRITKTFLDGEGGSLTAACEFDMF